jgi:hypothetical protein
MVDQADMDLEMADDPFLEVTLHNATTFMEVFLVKVLGYFPKKGVLSIWVISTGFFRKKSGF